MPQSNFGGASPRRSVAYEQQSQSQFGHSVSGSFHQPPTVYGSQFGEDSPTGSGFFGAQDEFATRPQSFAFSNSRNSLAMSASAPRGFGQLPADHVIIADIQTSAYLVV